MLTMPNLLASAALASSLALAPMLRPQSSPPASPPSTPPAQPDGAGKNSGGKDGDVLRGPKVPSKGIESDRPFAGGKGGKDPQVGQRSGAQMASRPAIEQGAFFTAVDAMGFDGDLKKSIDGARSDFLERVKQWETTSGEQRKKLFEQRKQASPSEPPSEEFKKKMAEIEASRPKIAELQQRVYGMLSEEQGAKLKDAYEAELKRVREEIAKKNEAERKRREEAAKKAAPEGRPADGAPSKDRSTAPSGRPTRPSAPPSAPPSTPPSTPPTKPAGDKPAAPGI